MQGTVAQHRQAVEQHLLDPNVIVEVLEMPTPLDGAEDVRGDRGRAMSAHVDAEGVCHVQDARDSEAARHVELQHVDGGHDLSDVLEHVRVLAGRDLERRMLADETNPFEVAGRDGLLEPADVPLERVALRPLQRDLRGERPVRVDEERRVVSDCLARGVEACRILVRRTAELHFHARDALRRPAAELLLQPGRRIAAEAAAAVHRHVAVRGAQKVDQRYPESSGLSVPERLVDGGDRTGRDARPPAVAHGAIHREPRRAHVLVHEVGELRTDQLGARRLAVGVADAFVHFADHDRRRVPLGGPVRLRLVGRNRAGVHTNLQRANE